MRDSTGIVHAELSRDEIAQMAGRVTYIVAPGVLFCIESACQIDFGIVDDAFVEDPVTCIRCLLR